MGDFNCKIGVEVKGNTETVPKGGKIMKNLSEKTNMQIVNTMELCKGTWTRVENGKKSVLDYVLIDKEEIKCLERMDIDESKDITPYKQTEERKVYIQTTIQ